jgi:hypothetical protein
MTKILRKDFSHKITKSYYVDGKDVVGVGKKSSVTTKETSDTELTVTFNGHFGNYLKNNADVKNNVHTFTRVGNSIVCMSTEKFHCVIHCGEYATEFLASYSLTDSGGGSQSGGWGGN